jgi:predicted DNA-binding transcriptional regulator YafY
MMGAQVRMIYRYIEQFREVDINIVKKGTTYSIDPTSPFIRDLTHNFSFTEDEALTILRVLNTVVDNSSPVRHLREKLSCLHDMQVLKGYGVDERVAENLSVLFKAIQNEQMVCLRNYSSPHSGKISDRIVEPFMFLPGNNEVRCYEVLTGENKTFKVSRAERVELIDLRWSNRDKHRPFYTDIFHFSAEEVFPITLRLGQLAHSVLLEEHPYAAPYITPESNGTYLLETDVCDFKGVSRFVLGLYDDIEVIGSKELREYLNDKIAKMKSY